MDEEKKDTVVVEVASEKKEDTVKPEPAQEKHPVKAMVYGIISLYLNVMAFSFWIVVFVMAILALCLKVVPNFIDTINEGKTGNEVMALDVARWAMFGMGLSFGLFDLLFSIGALVFGKAGRNYGSQCQEIGRARAGMHMGKVGYILGIVFTALGGLALLLCIIFSVI